jgi:preprotein translocase SecE subunit
MAVTHEKKMATTATATPDDGDRKEPRATPARAKTSSDPGFFSIYKRSQGYWTRMGTAIAAAVIGAFIAYNVYRFLPTFLSLPEQGSMTNDQFAVATTQAEKLHQHIALGASLGFLALYALLGWYLMNKPSNVEFLIATDVEMKKVNWTSRRELIGSTKVVVSFMFLTALFLFAVDIIFRFLMQLIHVLNPGAPF